MDNADNTLCSVPKEQTDAAVKLQQFLRRRHARKELTLRRMKVAEDKRILEEQQQKKATEFVNLCKAASNYPNQAWRAVKFCKAIQLLKKKSMDIDIDCVDASGLCCLHYACAMNALDIVAALIQNKANLNRTSKTSRAWSPLHFCVYYKNLELVNLLVENGAFLTKCGDDPRFKNTTPLEMCEKLSKTYITNNERIAIIEILETANTE